MLEAVYYKKGLDALTDGRRAKADAGRVAKRALKTAAKRGKVDKDGPGPNQGLDGSRGRARQ